MFESLLLRRYAIPTPAASLVVRGRSLLLRYLPIRTGLSRIIPKNDDSHESSDPDRSTSMTVGPLGWVTLRAVQHDQNERRHM